MWYLNLDRRMSSWCPQSKRHDRESGEAKPDQVYILIFSPRETISPVEVLDAKDMDLVKNYWLTDWRSGISLVKRALLFYKSFRHV